MFRFPTSFDELRFRVRGFWNRSLTNRLIVVCTLVWAAQEAGLFCAPALTLNPVWMRSGFWLNFLAHGFLHGGFWHIALNMLALYFAGNAVERYDTRGNALAVFLGGIAAGGLCWFAAVSALAPEPGTQTLVGASAGIAALFAYFSVANRGAEIRALLFFVLPVQMRAWALFAVLVGISLLGFVFFEIPTLRGAVPADAEQQTAALQTVAHSAHLGGALFGAVYALARERLNAFRGNTFRFRR